MHDYPPLQYRVFEIKFILQQHNDGNYHIITGIINCFLSTTSPIRSIGY